MRLRPVALIIIIFSVLFGHRAFAGEFNLAPVVFYESGEKDYALNMIGPIFAFSSNRAAIRPLFYHDEQQTDILFPLGHSTKNKGLFFPIYASSKENHHTHRNLFPLFYGRYREKNYGGLFPLYGSLYHRFGYDNARFVLWPVYSATTTEDTCTYYVLWPIFSYSTGKEFKIFPLYGYKKTITSRHDFALWPLFHHKRGIENVDAVLPLFFYSRGDFYKSISIIWPLFTHSRDFRINHTIIDCPWPLIRFAQGGYEEARIFPFYHRKIIPPTYSVRSVFWPLYRKELNFDKDRTLRREKTTILILSNHSHEVSEQGEETFETTVWPVWHRTDTAHDRSWCIPWLLPFRHEGYKRNWMPLFTLARSEKTSEYSSVDILWHTIFYKRDDRSSQISLSFLFSSEKGMDYRELGFFFNLLKVRLPQHQAD